MRMPGVLVVVLSLAACGETARPSAGPVTRDSAGVRIVEIENIATLPLPDWTLGASPRLTIGGQDARPGHDLFGVRGGGVLSDGRVVLGNGTSGELRFFRPDGTLALTTGRSGSGPGEFRGMFSLQVLPGDTSLVYDVMTRRLSRFNGDGQLSGASVMQPPSPDAGYPEPVGTLDNGTLLVVPGFNRIFTRGERRDTVPYFLFDRGGARLDSIAAFPGSEQYFGRVGDAALRSEIPFGRNVFASAAANTIVIGASDTWQVSTFDATGRRTTIIRSRAPAPATTDAELRAWKQDHLRRMGSGERAQMWERFYAELPNRPTHPAFAALQVDRLNRVWVGREDPADAARLIWEVLSAAGEPLGRVHTPALRILEIGADYILGVTQDDVDREVVALYPLVRR